MKILIVVGARPNFMKAAPIMAAIEQHNARGAEKIELVLVHTGQHYDEIMSDRFFADLNLRKPDVQLGVGSGSHALQTAEVLKRFEPVLLHQDPDVVIVVGDVNSTLACALVTAKIGSEDSPRPVIVHVEAGLRSFDRAMPEEVNRIATDHLSDLLFVTEQSGVDNLTREGIPAEKIHLVGNTMIDSLLACREKARDSTILDSLGLWRHDTMAPYILLTLHRPSNVDHPGTFVQILDALEDVPGEYQILFPAHPRTQKRIQEFGLDARFNTGRIRMLPPLGYVDFLCLMSNARLVVTDSGGIQEETTCLGVPCVTVRESTERPITVEMGTNVLAGVACEQVRAAVQRQLFNPPSGCVPPLWDGQTAHRIVDVIVDVVAKRQAQVPEYAHAS